MSKKWKKSTFQTKFKISKFKSFLLYFVPGWYGVQHRTARNTGFQNGSKPIIEKQVGKNLLYLACRHHIYEIFLRSAIEILVPKSTSPFTKMSKNNIKLLTLPTLVETLIPGSKRHFIDFYEGIICAQVRNDYKESACDYSVRRNPTVI